MNINKLQMPGLTGKFNNKSDIRQKNGWKYLRTMGLSTEHFQRLKDNREKEKHRDYSGQIKTKGPVYP